MFDVDFYIEDISVSSIEKEDVILVQHWINNQYINSENEKPLMFNDFYERFLEYYVSENEFFLKIEMEDKLIGVIKGRIEFKNINEVWLWYYLLDKDYRNKGIGSKIIEAMIKYFNVELGIFDFYAVVSERDTDIYNFWKKSSFKKIRVSKDFFNISGEDMDMIILKFQG
ncbi:GNAT family N-acetyltransferase [Candidatus Clostridium radicumherbarum]|uniref:GNAT family N-acetyltransferase n=1 Tax=Candidatus Clostridium radicumherbarum TaxID=3381662 RepID=A0ABW8TQI4_9CLOT